MKQKLTISLAFTFLVLLTLSSFNQASPISVSQAEPINTTYETGDSFRFSLDRYEDRYSTSFSSIWNASDESDIWNYREEERDEDTILFGDFDVDILRDRPSLPDNEFGGRFDTLAFAEMTVTTQPGSQSSGSRNETRFDEFGVRSWDNQTFPVEDRSGMTFSQSMDEVEDIRSNATYALIFSEIEDQYMYVPNFFFFGLPDNSNFTQMVPVNRTVSLASDWLYTINGVDQLLDVRIVDTTASYQFSESFPMDLPFGPDDDPNTPWGEVNATYWIDMSISTSYVFDQANGAFLENNNNLEFGFDMDFYASNITLVSTDDLENEWTRNIGIDSSFSFSTSESDSLIIEEASSQYGRVRAVSTGTNRIEEGALLEYEFDTYQSGQFSSQFEFVGGPTSFSKSDQQSQWSDGTGIVTLDVFRHSPDGFEAVIFGEGVSNGGFDSSVESYEDGQLVDSYSNSSTYGPVDFLFGEIDTLLNSADLDVSPVFEDRMALPDFFNDNDCDGGDCDDGDFKFQIPPFMPKVGLVNDTILVIPPEVDDAGVLQEGATLTINGFDYLFYEVRYVAQKYEMREVRPVQFPLGGEDGEEPLWVNGEITIEGNGIEAYFYDIDTGALLAQMSSMDLYVSIVVSEAVPTTDPLGNPVTVQIDLQFEINWEDEFDITLLTHPTLYQTAQDLSTVTNPHETTDVVSSSDPTTTTTDDTSSNADTESSADLPLPLPFLPITAGIVVVSLVLRIRRSKY